MIPHYVPGQYYRSRVEGDRLMVRACSMAFVVCTAERAGVKFTAVIEKPFFTPDDYPKESPCVN